MIPAESIKALRSMAEAMEPDLLMSASVLKRLVDDFETHGPISRLVGDHPDARQRFFGLRVLAGVRLLVLQGKAPALAAHLKDMTSNLGDESYNEKTWELFQYSALSHHEEILEALGRPVQQHQPGRAAWLLRGLGMLKAPRIRLLEVGACAGLNLLVDKYRWFGPGWEWGDPQSPVRLPGSGPAPGEFTIVDRAGCDLAPRNAADPHDAMILRSFIPHERDIDQMELDDAIVLAAREGIVIEQEHAIPWLAKKLAPTRDYRHHLTVVWHSVFSQYLTPQEQGDVDEILAEAARHTPLARVAAEPPTTFPGPPLLQIHVYS
ncbi:hypothetical protein QFZ63_000085 [Streptomyces sp. B3I7]|uniref:DUF2332 domain-containing protein n=1 Tax=Streptomyces sp. B3I7 TaxID=3042269 RepID=UPI002785BB68|nr:DUF2332 domain-containing protein [Streptomyces sp. B3I7]MDQ0808371.1 hypothetical protein [Streptomyces sp. B3I7]